MLDNIKTLFSELLSDKSDGMMTYKEHIDISLYYTTISINIYYTESIKKPITDEILIVHTQSITVKNEEVSDDIKYLLYINCIKFLVKSGVISNYSLIIKLRP